MTVVTPSQRTSVGEPSSLALQHGQYLMRAFYKNLGIDKVLNLLKIRSSYGEIGRGQ